MDMDTIGPVLIALPMFGFLVTMFLPREWQNVQGWLIVSFLGIPGFLIVFALLANAPGLLIGGAFVLGILAMGKR